MFSMYFEFFCYDILGTKGVFLVILTEVTSARKNYAYKYLDISHN